MNRDLEQSFFAALKEVTESCMEWMSLKYSKPTNMNEPSLQRLVKLMNNARERRLPSEIASRFNNFMNLYEEERGGILAVLNDLMKEIEENLSYLTENNKKAYVFGLLTPFYELSNKKKEYRDTLFLRIWAETTPEYCLKRLYMVAELYSGYLDAVLLKYKLDLLRLQKECGTTLREERCMKTIAERLGSRELAELYIKALPEVQCGKPQQETKLEKQYFARATEAGFMEETATGYKWTWGGKKARLAYFITKIYGDNQQIPYKRLEAMFDVSRLDSAVYQLMNAKRPQKWRQQIDGIFEDENSA